MEQQKEFEDVTIEAHEKVKVAKAEVECLKGVLAKIEANR